MGGFPKLSGPQPMRLMEHTSGNQQASIRSRVPGAERDAQRSSSSSPQLGKATDCPGWMKSISSQGSSDAFGDNKPDLGIPAEDAPGNRILLAEMDIHSASLPDVRASAAPLLFFRNLGNQGGGPSQSSWDSGSFAKRTASPSCTRASPSRTTHSTAFSFAETRRVTASSTSTSIGSTSAATRPEGTLMRIAQPRGRGSAG